MGSGRTKSVHVDYEIESRLLVYLMISYSAFLEQLRDKILLVGNKCIQLLNKFF